MKKTIAPILTLTILVLGFSFAGSSENESEKYHSAPENDLHQSQDPFDKMMLVLTHPRCVNCHPAGNKPIKGEDSHVTRALGIPRGSDGHGLKSINCSTCHTDENNDFSGVPGAPEWALVPEIMTWEGKTRIEIATQMMDPRRNGGRSVEEVMKHLTEHELVLWA
ncbi:MAG: hypothetical protein ACJA1A_000471 [Saprospiraceae bacterium]|jgi:hypothetical protein